MIVFSGVDGSVLESFFAYDPGFSGGVRVGAYTLSGQGAILTGPGPGGGPQVTVYDGASLAVLDSFFAYDPTFTGGLYVAGC